MILVLAPSADETVAAVTRRLERRGAAFRCLDPADLPSRVQLSWRCSEAGHAEPLLRLAGESLDLRDVTAVWHRAPARPVPAAAVTGVALRAYVEQETADAWTGMMETLDCRWLPGSPSHERRAGLKPLQLTLAAGLGLEIPATLVTSSPGDFRDFYRRHDARIITKTVRTRVVALPGSRFGGEVHIYTEVVSARDVGYAETVRYCPLIVQPYVPKRLELRIVVVGRQVFAAEIHSQRTHHTRYDWRHEDPHHARYQAHDLPKDVAQRCAALVARLGLLFGAIDMILTPEGRYVFLEVNPNGEWLWIERTTGLPIGDAICELLLLGAETASRAPMPDVPDARVVPAPAVPSPLQRRRSHPVSKGLDLALRETLACLLALGRGRVPPPEAREAFRRLAARHPTIGMDLLWEEEGSGTVHYDAVLDAPGRGTLSLAFCPDRGVPWALRHAHHAREADVLRVNGRTLNVHTIMGYLDVLWDDARLLDRLVDGCLMLDAMEAHTIEVPASETRAALAAFRGRHGLRTRAGIRAWLARRGWTADDLEYEIGRQVAAAKLRERLVGARVDAYFARYRTGLDTATIARCTFRDAGSAVRLCREMRRGAVGFLDAIEARFLAGDLATAAPVFEIVRRRQLSPRHAARVFGAAPGAVVGPLAGSGGHDVVRVLRVNRARLDDETREAIKQILFAEWLAARRREATVEWFWGEADKVPAGPADGRGPSPPRSRRTARGGGRRPRAPRSRPDAAGATGRG